MCGGVGCACSRCAQRPFRSLSHVLGAHALRRPSRLCSTAAAAARRLRVSLLLLLLSSQSPSRHRGRNNGASYGCRCVTKGLFVIAPLSCLSFRSPSLLCIPLLPLPCSSSGHFPRRRAVASLFRLLRPFWIALYQAPGSCGLLARSLFTAPLPPSSSPPRWGTLDRGTCTLRRTRACLCFCVSARCTPSLSFGHPHFVTLFPSCSSHHAALLVVFV